MSGRIFISYRRDDERHATARLRERLAGVFGQASVFMDVDILRPGQRFDKVLEAALQETDVFLAVIGPRWLSLLQTKAAVGDHDFVRYEISQALARGVTVVPVLVEGASLPRHADLPSDIAAMVLHQKHELTYERFGRDAEALIDAIHDERAERERALAQAAAMQATQRTPRARAPERPPQAGAIAPGAPKVAKAEQRSPQSGDDRKGWIVAGAIGVAVLLSGATGGYWLLSGPAGEVSVVKADTSAPRSVLPPRPSEPTPVESPAAKKVPTTVEKSNGPIETPLPDSPTPVPGEGPARKVATVPIKRDGTVGPAPDSSPQSGAVAYLAIISTRRTRAEALRDFADLEQKYPDILGSRVPLVIEKDFGTTGPTGIWYRLTVGPPGSKEHAQALCRQLADRGYKGCFALAY